MVLGCLGFVACFWGSVSGLCKCRLWLNGLYAVTIRLHDGRLRVPRIFVFLGSLEGSFGSKTLNPKVWGSAV